MIDPRKFQEYLKFRTEYEAMLKTDIQAEYKKVVDAIAEWDKRRNYDQLRSQLEQDRNTHTTTVKEWEAVRDKYTTDMQAWHTALTKKEEELSKKAAEMKGQYSDLLTAQSNHEQVVKSHKEAYDQRAKDLDQKAVDLESMQKVLQKKESDLSIKQTKMVDAITSVSSLR